LKKVINISNFKFPYQPSLLNPKEVKLVIEKLDINVKGQKVNQKGYVKICNPFKMESKQSFSINVNKGNFIDFDDQSIKGDIVQLVQLARNYSRERAEVWIANMLKCDTKGFKLYKYMLSKRLKMQNEFNQTLNK